MLTEAILAHTKKRNYPHYKYARRADIWTTREALMEYEEALAIEARVDSILESKGIVRARSRSVATKTPARQFKTPGTPASALKANTSAKRENKENTSIDDDDYSVLGDDLKPDSPRVQEARLVKEIFEVAFPRWKDLVAVKGEQEGRPAGLERFDSGT